jgi:hypothetical protein
MADMQSPWADAPVPTPGTEGEISSTKGGFDLVDNAPKETPNSVSGLGLQPTTINMPDAPGVGATVPVPDLTGRIPGTISGS